MIRALRRRWWRERVAPDSPLHALLSVALPHARTRLSDVDLLALDFETTGLRPAHDTVVSAGWLRLHGGVLRLAGAGETWLRPEGDAGVGDSATIHGLRDVDLGEGGDERALLDLLLPALTGRVLLAHGSGIESGFLDAILRRRHGVPFLSPRVCTLALEARLCEVRGERPGPGGLTLAACRARRGLPAYREHDALSDALACAELFLAQVAEFGGFDDVRLGDVTSG
ncbi:exonuclease domain-containing protein [Luteimonas salinilitoris]|uniref:Exonuclease domain-containing protein n=1 Tax=Luteimonas salinilitoris TaxID=3237697 RepID=A0ABV4HX71_9GAMM